jgi:hypothetical protein
MLYISIVATPVIISATAHKGASGAFAHGGEHGGMAGGGVGPGLSRPWDGRHPLESSLPSMAPAKQFEWRVRRPHT